MAYEDLLKDTSKPDPDNKDYFLLTVTDLDPGKTYPIELRWVYKNDKSKEDQEWSVVKNLITPAETMNTPRFLSTDLLADGFNLVVKWSGTDSDGNAYDANLDRVEIFIKGGQYGATSTYSGRSFKSAGTEIFAVNTSDTYYVKLRAVSKRGGYSEFSSEHAVTTVAPLVVDITGPSNVTSVTISSGIDTSGYLGFNAYADISWPAVSDTTLRGYRIRFRTGTDPYSYVDSPGTGTSYRLGGLAIGATYEVAVATYDHLNNTSSSYVSGSNVTVTGTPSVSNYIEGGPFQFGVGVGGVSTNKGLYFDASNYWYVNASNSARLKVGGSTSNYLLWDGSTFAIDGNITARGGSFSGNVAMTSTGASIYNGTLDGTGALSSDGFILNKNGLQFKYGGATAITLQTSDGTLFATNATITGTIRTAAASSYPRVELKSTSSKDYIFFYDASNQAGSINVTGNGDGGMYFTAPATTASQIALYGSNHTSFPGRVSILDGSASTLLYLQSNYLQFSNGGTPIFSASSSGLVISENNTTDNSGSSVVRNIQSTTTTGYPTASGRTGDIILVRES
jgi:hypothetical protein